MNSQPLYLFLVFFAFGLCGWVGCASFLYEGSSWLKIENPSVQSLLLHENSVRVFLISLLWGGICAFPFQWMHRKKQQMLGVLLFLPLSITVIPAIYLYLWPSQSFSFSWYEQLKNHYRSRMVFLLYFVPALYLPALFTVVAQSKKRLFIQRIRAHYFEVSSFCCSACSFNVSISV